MQTISEKIVAALPVPETGNKLHYFSGATLQGKTAPSGFAVRVTAAGSKAFVWFHRVDGKPHLETIGSWIDSPKGGDMTVLGAIVKCSNRAKAVATGVDRKGNDVDPRPERTRNLDEVATVRTIGDVLDEFIERYLKKADDLRTADAIERELNRLVRPRIGKTGIYDLKRSHVSKMLNEIADENGARMADLALAYTRRAFNWFEVNGADDDFRSPIVRGMARTKPSDRERTRVLADDEIRDLWAALDVVTAPKCFPIYVKTLLLTATRRAEASNMNTLELDGDVWTIPASRYKTKLDFCVPLSPTARELIGELLPKKSHKAGYFLFSTTGGEKPIAEFSKCKIALDKAIANIRQKAGREPMEHWTWHDLRRSGRTLMSRAKVNADIAERCLGHVIAGVRGVYDRHAYLDEKRDAFERLAAMVSNILNPESNVIAIRR